MTWRVSIDEEREGELLRHAILCIGGPDGVRIELKVLPSSRFKHYRCMLASGLMDGRRWFTAPCIVIDGDRLSLDTERCDVSGRGFHRLSHAGQSFVLPHDLKTRISDAFEKLSDLHEEMILQHRRPIIVETSPDDPFGDARVRWLMPWARSVDRRLRFAGSWRRCSFCERAFVDDEARTLLLGDSTPGIHPEAPRLAARVTSGTHSSGGYQVCEDIEACLARGTYPPEFAQPMRG